MLSGTLFYLLQKYENQLLLVKTDEVADSFELTTNLSIQPEADEIPEPEQEPEQEPELQPEQVVTNEIDDLTFIKKEIELECNFSSAKEAMAAVTANPSVIVERLQTGFDMFEERTGKKGMTYSQLREMFG